mmetsp:Transcript_15806/g.32174  ORF Transcript_15806/g.32174 Transcript_15806/m.32174 type:complete len:752 (+) Transcript_15806:238-2493(+)
MAAISATIVLASTLFLPNLAVTENDRLDRHEAFLRRRKLANAQIASYEPTSLPRQVRTYKRQRHRRNQIDLQQQHQPHQGERRHVKKKSNDVGHITIPLSPFTIRIVNVSSLGISGLESDAILDIINETTAVGTQILAESDFYGERFLDLDLGEVWAVDFEQYQDVSDVDGTDDETNENDAAKISKTSNYDDEMETEAQYNAQDHDQNGDEVWRHVRSVTESPSDMGTAMITLGQNGTVHFKGSYFLEDPLAEEVTLVLVKGLSEMDKRNDLVKILNSALQQESLSDLNVSALNVEVVSLQDADLEDDGGIEEMGEESEEVSVTGEKNPSKEVETGEEHFEEELGETEQVEKPETEESPAGANEKNDVINEENGSQRQEENQDDYEDKASSGSIEEIYTPGRIESSPEESVEIGGKQSRIHAKVVVPIVLGLLSIVFVLIGITFRKRRQKETNADHSYRNDHANSDIVQEDLHNNDHDESPTLNVPMTASDPQNSTSATKNIDKLLADFSDGDSSFISEPSEATNSVFSGFSGFSGLSSFLGETNHDAVTLSGRNSGAFALEDVAHVSSRLSHYSNNTAVTEDKTTGINRTSEGRGSYLPSNLRKPESFEGHKATSAMAQFALRKDILQVLDGSDVYKGSDRGEGTSRTISPKKSGKIMEKQIMKDKKEYQERYGIRPCRGSRDGVHEASDDDDDSSDDDRLTSGPKSSNFDALEPRSRKSSDELDDVQSLESSENIMSIIPLHRNGSAMT